MKREIFYIINKALQLSKAKIIASVVSVALIGGGTAYTVINSQSAEDQKEDYIESTYNNENLEAVEPTEDKSIELVAAKKPAEDNAEAKQKGNTQSDSAIEKDIPQISGSMAIQESQLSNPVGINNQATDLSEKNTHEIAIDGTGVQVNNTFSNSISIKQESADKKVDSKPSVSNKEKNPIASIVDTVISAVKDKNSNKDNENQDDSNKDQDDSNKDIGSGKVDSSSDNKSDVEDTKKDDSATNSEHKHNESEWKTVKEASCTETGLEEIICTLCNEIVNSKVISAKGHTYEVSEAKLSSCTEAGYTIFKCKDCDDTYKENNLATEHNYLEKSRTEASCTANGIVTYECIFCGASFTEVLSATDHNFTKTGNLAPTCVSDGNNIYTCQGCGDTYTEIISAMTHNYEKVADNGHLAVYQCTGCGDSYEEVYSEEHHYSQTSKVDATCTAAGSVTYQCDDCGDIYEEILPILVHKEVAEIIAQPTCSNEGTIVTKCSVCGEIIKTEAIPVIEHNLEIVVTKQPTCLTEGIRTSQCKVCGTALATESIDRLSHQYEVIETIQPTCMAAGKITYKCKKCNDSYNEEIEKTEHTYKSVVRAGTCTTKEQTVYTCEACGDSYTEETGNYGVHEYELTSKVDATCIINGKEIQTCKYCGDEKITTKKATGHEYKVTDTKKATCTEKGEITYSCKKCSDSYTDESPITEHTEGDWEVIREATESENGLKIKSCTVCGAKLQEEEIEKVTSTDQEYTITTTEGTETVIGHYDYAYAEQLIEMLNDYREENGLDRLEVDQNLVDGACIRAYEITHTFEHDRPDGTKCYTACPSASGENIASVASQSFFYLC